LQDLKVHLFYYCHHLIHISRNQLPIYYHYRCGIYAIYLRLDNQFVQRFEHAFMFAWQCVKLYHRAITQRDSPVSRDPALSIYVENFTGHPFVSTSTRHDEMESRDTDTDAVINRRARANPVRDVATMKVIYTTRLRQVSRRVKRARVKYDGVSRRIIFFSHPFFAPII